MAIPHDDVIKEELLKLLEKSPNQTIHCNDAYAKLARLFPEITDSELNKKYRNSISKWANRVQFARLHCVNDGHIYDARHPKSHGRGWWTITGEGHRYVNKIFK